LFEPHRKNRYRAWLIFSNSSDAGKCNFFSSSIVGNCSTHLSPYPLWKNVIHSES